MLGNVEAFSWSAAMKFPRFSDSIRFKIFLLLLGLIVAVPIWWVCSPLTRAAVSPLFLSLAESASITVQNATMTVTSRDRLQFLI